MTTNTRATVASAHARIDALDAKLDQILAAIATNAPAKTVRKPAQKKTTTRKAAPKKAAPVKVTKGAQTRESLTRKDFNRTVTTKARLQGGDAYKRVIAAWAQVQEAAKAGMTPDEALALVLG